ncbi:MAG: PAS domain-containing protein [Janthinobacterium lividum]
MMTFSGQKARGLNNEPTTQWLRSIPGEMAEMVERYDWAATPLGPLAQWGDTLLSAVGMVLSANIPMQIFWGPEMITLYNEALRPALAEKHPYALGMPAREVWGEVWSEIGPQLEGVLRGKAVRFHAVPLKLLRNGVLEEMFWDYSYSPVLAPDGTVAGILDVALDVTESVLAKRQLEASEAHSLRVAQQLSQVLGVTTDAVVSVNRDWVITYLNPAAEALYGPSIEMVGRNVWECFPDAVYEGSPYTEHFNRAMNEGIIGRFEAHYPDPLNLWIQIEVYPTPDGIISLSRDITQRRNVERALEESERIAVRSERQLQVIMDALPAYLSYLDPGFRYVRVNRTYEEWFDRSGRDIVGKTIEEVLGAESADIVRSQMRYAFAGERRQFEYKITIKDQERVLSVEHIPDFDDAGKVQGVIVQGQDITERKQTEKALLQSEKLAAVGRLAASIAHEINNPLESVTNLLYLARRTSEMKEVQDYLDTAERELRRVSVISNQTLRFYKQSTNPRPVTSKDLLESVLSIYQGRLVNSRITVVADRETDKHVECFDGEIRQVLNNLIGNAIDAMHPLGGRLILRSRASTHWSTGERGVTITIADTGSGMPSHVLERAFDAFYTTKGIGGTGLGLWVSNEIIVRHNGALRIRSSQSPGHRGTVFVLFLPFAAVTR